MKPSALFWPGLASGVAVLAFWASTQPKPMALTDEERRTIVQKVRTEVGNGQVIYNLGGLSGPIPVSFVVADQKNAAESWCLNDPARGVTMGIDVNEKLAAQNWHRFVKETIPHEVAHLLMCQMGLPDWDQHTAAWSTIVRDQGADPKPFHDYRTEQ